MPTERTSDGYRAATMSEAEGDEHDRAYGELADRTRDLLEAQLLTEVDHDEVAEVCRELRDLTSRLRAKARSGPHGVELGPGDRVVAHGNAVVGRRNPIAPPLHIERSEEGWAWSTFRLGAAYEGPPGLVHGGVSALVLDQLCGEAASAGGSPRYDGSADGALPPPHPAGRGLRGGLDRPRRGLQDLRRGAPQGRSGSAHGRGGGPVRAAPVGATTRGRAPR